MVLAHRLWLVGVYRASAATGKHGGNVDSMIQQMEFHLREVIIYLDLGGRRAGFTREARLKYCLHYVAARHLCRQLGRRIGAEMKNARNNYHGGGEALTSLQW